MTSLLLLSKGQLFKTKNFTCAQLPNIKMLVTSKKMTTSVPLGPKTKSHIRGDVHTSPMQT